MKEILALISPQPGILNFQEAIKLASQLLPPGAIAAVTQGGLALAKAADRQLPPEVSPLLQMMASAAIAPDMFKLMRTQFGISQQEIAKACRVDPSNVSRWEQRETTLPPFAIAALITIMATKQIETENLLSGNDIIALRHALGFSQSRFAETMGVAPLTVLNWERRADHPLPHRASAKVWEVHEEPLKRLHHLTPPNGVQTTQPP